jgi:hypothetical protein
MCDAWAISDPQALLIGASLGSFKFHELKLVPTSSSKDEPLPHNDVAGSGETRPAVETEPATDPVPGDLDSRMDEPLDTPIKTKPQPAASISRR